MLRSWLKACLAGMLVVGLAGCSLLDKGGQELGLGGGATSPTPESAGFVVGDEPLAVQAGTQILAQGGSAADAATATYFALAATYPVAAGLGGGGICIVHDETSAKSEAFDFLPRSAAKGGAFAVPGNVRGFASLHAVFGRLPWQRDVAAGEGYATAGFPISNALETRLRASQNVIRLDAALAAEFLEETGAVKPFGASASNADLGATLSAIREFGAGGFYRGDVAAKLAAYSAGQGGALTETDLAGYPANRTPPMAIAIGNQTAFLPPQNLGAGAYVRALLAHVLDANGQIPPDANPAQRVAAATKAVLDSFGLSSLPRDMGSTGFAVTDGQHQAVACAVTMNGAFGSGHTAAGTGVTLAGAPTGQQAGYSGAFLTPAIAIVQGAGTLSLAGAGAGGPNGTATVLDAVLRQAFGADITQPGQIHSTGLAPYNTINAIACESDLCTAIPDPGGQGLGMSASQDAAQ
jgi:gamma-glutamyltranspeptidase/glutathione hydrolase